MNLTQFFNFDYFIQNIKKSKSSIIFSSIILPVLTIVYLLIVNSVNSTAVVSFDLYNLFNMLFMYIIPVILSVSLFDYVFKKNSADFVGALPISRKCIFITNTVFGILLLIGIQAITAIISFIISQFLPNIILFNGLIFDSFLYYSIAYIFVFIVCNLAVSISGNLFATIATTMLVLFFIPFTMLLTRSSSTYFSNYSDYNNELVVYEDFNFTAPSRIFEFVINDSNLDYNAVSIIKMLAFSTLYFIIGLRLFERKKLEMAEESFENEKIHLIIKFLTLAPFVGIATTLNIIDYLPILLFFIIALAIYYYIFDVITKKKIRLSVSIASFLISVLAMYAFYDSIVPKFDFIFRKNIDVNSDIQSVILVGLNGKGGRESNINLFIDDKEIIKEIFYSRNHTYDINKYNSYGRLKIKLNNNKEYEIKRYLSDALEMILAKYGDTPFELEKGTYEAVLEDHSISKEEKKQIIELVNKDLEGKTLRDYFEIIFGNREYYNLYVECYNNHRIVVNDMSYLKLNNTSELVIKALNKEAFEKSNRIIHSNIGYGKDFEKYLRSVNENLVTEYNDEYIQEPKEVTLYGNEVDKYAENYIKVTYEDFVENLVYEGAGNISSSSLEEYIKEHGNDEFDHSKPYFVLINYIRNGNTIFYSNDIEGFYKIFAKAYNESSDLEGAIKLNEKI